MKGKNNPVDTEVMGRYLIAQYPDRDQAYTIWLADGSQTQYFTHSYHEAVLWVQRRSVAEAVK